MNLKCKLKKGAFNCIIPLISVTRFKIATYTLSDIRWIQVWCLLTRFKDCAKQETKNFTGRGGWREIQEGLCLYFSFVPICKLKLDFNFGCLCNHEFFTMNFYITDDSQRKFYLIIFRFSWLLLLKYLQLSWYLNGSICCGILHLFKHIGSFLHVLVNLPTKCVQYSINEK